LKLNSIKVPNGIAFQFEVSLLAAKNFPWPYFYEDKKGQKPNNALFFGLLFCFKLLWATGCTCPSPACNNKAAGIAWAATHAGSGAVTAQGHALQRTRGHCPTINMFNKLHR